MSKNPNPNLSSNEQQLLALRHSAEHVLTYAMQRLYGQDRVIMAMGPATADGFYFDFDTPEDFIVNEQMLGKIEKEMKQLIKANLSLIQIKVTLPVARSVFINNPYKQEWLDGIESEGEQVSLYLMGTKEQLENDQALFQKAQDGEILDPSIL